MFQFNILNEPPTAAQLRQIKSELLAKRRALLKYAGLSDCPHLVVFCALYFFGLLSGRGVLGVAVSSIVVALLLAARQDPSSKRFKIPLLVIVTGIMMLASLLFSRLRHAPAAGRRSDRSRCLRIGRHPGNPVGGTGQNCVQDA